MYVICLCDPVIVCVCACVRACVHACVRACVCVCVNFNCTVLLAFAILGHTILPTE